MASEKEKKGKEWTASSAVNEFDEYLRQSDPERREKAVIWKPKISDLRAVDRSREPLKSLRHLEPRGKSGVDFYLKLQYNIILFNEVQRWPQTPIKK